MSKTEKACDFVDGHRAFGFELAGGSEVGLGNAFLKSVFMAKSKRTRKSSSMACGRIDYY